ncbi:Death-associated protein kinase 3 [Exaiptasia diaphana]|nr:Death-associated protein kinase 3 [Exaiptasia diaphana]
MSKPGAKKFGPQIMELKKESPENTYQIKAEVARGKYAIIKRCMDKKTKKNMMAKLIKYDKDTEKLAIQEFTIMRDLKNDKLLTTRDGFHVRKYIVIMMDSVEAKNMLEFLGEKPRANEEDAAFVMRQTLEALKYLHANKIVHLDVRPANILVKKDYTLKLIDYGCARKINADGGELVDAIGVTEFAAPELLNMDPVCWAADMWSIGVILYMLLSATLPFYGEDEDDVTQAVIAVDYEMPADKFAKASDDAKALVKSLITKIPEKRPNATKVLDGEWLGSGNAQKRKTTDIPSSKFKELNQTLTDEDKEEAVDASGVLRSFDEEEYESPEEEEEE